MHRTAKQFRSIEISLFDPNNRRAVSALLPDAIVHQLDALWKSPHSGLLAVGEVELMKMAKRMGKPLCGIDHRLRMQFWFEYDLQLQNPDASYPALNMARVIGRACAKETFYKHVITEPIRLAYLLTPPQNYLDAIEVAMITAMSAITEILELPITKVNGEPDILLAEKKTRLLEKLFRLIRSVNGEVINPEQTGRRPGQRMRESKIEEARPPESPDEKITRMQAEIESMKAEHVNQIGGVDDAT